MVKSRIWSEISSDALKHRGFQAIFYVLVFLILAGAVLVFLNLRSRDAGIKKEVLRNWESGFYAEAFEKSSAALEKRPLDFFLLTINGFVSYQLAVSRINSPDTLVYLDRCVYSLRKALLKSADRSGGIRYVLGKAYYGKGPEFADLSARYLEEARASGYSAKDIPEYLGLAYEAIREYRKSIEVLTGALDAGGGSPDQARLLFVIARSYMGLEDWHNAGAYLRRCLEQTRDSGEAMKVRLMLGKALAGLGDVQGAEELYGIVLETAENAEAAYELGEIYAARGDAIRARAFWRRSYWADSNYRPARVRLNL